jgi:hypothetical protein
VSAPAELNALTKWKSAPWKWLFSNPKGTGYCDRWGYKFKMLSDKDAPRSVACQMVKKQAQKDRSDCRAGERNPALRLSRAWHEVETFWRQFER